MSWLPATSQLLFWFKPIDLGLDWGAFVLCLQPHLQTHQYCAVNFCSASQVKTQCRLLGFSGVIERKWSSPSAQQKTNGQVYLLPGPGFCCFAYKCLWYCPCQWEDCLTASFPALHQVLLKSHKKKISEGKYEQNSSIYDSSFLIMKFSHILTIKEIYT